MDVKRAKRKGYIISPEGKEMKIPNSWKLLPPGDAALTRRIKKDGPYWILKEPFKRRMVSKGVFAPKARINQLKAELEIERADPAYTKKLEAGRTRRAKLEKVYVEDFKGAVKDFLNFHPLYQETAEKLAGLISTHATPVGSGTVARTKRIPIERRAEAATIAWLRHQTTSYDHMKIPRVKGQRREIRKMLAEESRRRLLKYREGEKIASNCPIWSTIHG